ncbi:hypothetical protein HPB51_010482 [Rhipicephalus microplus]|uniref:Uncharacterized protein n=1 Tax=Rhipicephalus microplus TaxID=6941 RepID=A0A9J6E0L3_RHIMP|nr:hypothetical protein HPB51_010482 [Rhipicephalus microplus]
METLSFVWGYGVDRLLFDVRFMEQGTLSNYWIRCWSLWTPCVLLGVLVATFVTLQDFVDDLASNYNVQAKFACQFLLVGMLAGVPVLTMEWLMENNLVTRPALLRYASRFIRLGNYSESESGEAPLRRLKHGSRSPP